MSRRKQTTHRRIQPYSWLGAGAVTLGMGAAMVGGTAVAFATTGADSAGPSSSAASDAPSSTGRATDSATGPRAARAARAGSAVADGPARRGRIASAPAAAPVVSEAIPTVPEIVRQVTASRAPAAAAAQTAIPAPEPVAVNKALPVVATPATAPTRAARADRAARAAAAASTLATPVPDVKDSPATAPAASVAPAAADPAPTLDSWLPGGANPGDQIVPGAHFETALAEIKAAQGLIREATWGAGNLLAGIGSLGPQALLATAQLSLLVWAGTIGGVQNFMASTAGIPLIKYLGRAAIFNELLVPAVSDFTLGVAAKLVPTLGWVGADVTAAEATVVSARQNGKIYAVVPIRVKLGTQPMVNAKLNDGRNASLLLDTGASGLVTTSDKIGSAPLGAPIGSGDSCFSGGICYHYETYEMTVDLGGGAVTTAPVNIVTDNEQYPNSVANFKEFFFYGDGILGVGANTAGPGPAPIPTAAMPGELSDGVLIHQSLLPLGLGGVMVLGPNPLPTKVSLPGAPNSFVKVSINDGALQDGSAIIDSGGVFGTLNKYFIPSAPYPGNVPAGTKIDVYAPDGTTLLYSYTAQSGDAGTPLIDTGLFNTGNVAYKQNPIYLNYGFDQPYGIGSTDFSIW